MLFRSAQRKERQRCTDINALCDKFDIESEQRSKWINDGTNVETVNRELLEVLSTGNAARVSVKPEMGAAEEDKLRAAYRDGLALRAGIAIAKPADGAFVPAARIRGFLPEDNRATALPHGEAGRTSRVPPSVPYVRCGA